MVDGDHVKTGQIVGSIIAQNSEAAIAGAESMLRSARTPSEKQDAERALAIAREGAVAAPLRFPEAGVVVSHQASEGDLVNDHQPILSIAATDSIVFVASIAQADLPKIHPRETVLEDVASRTASLRGRVHGILPRVSLTDLRAPVRIDFIPAQAGLQIRVFGTARIVVAETALALAPLELALGHGSQLMQPLAIGIIGGFTLSRAAVLFLLPGLLGCSIPTGDWAETHARPPLLPERGYTGSGSHVRVRALHLTD